MALRGIGPPTIQSFPLADLLTASTPHSSVPAGAKAPTPPWRKTDTPGELSATLKAALSGKKLIDETTTQLDLRGASADYAKLFALYQGLGALVGIATHAFDKKAPEAERISAQKAFAAGLAEVRDYAQTAKLQKLRLAVGEASTNVKTTLGVPKAKADYVTRHLTSSVTDPVAAFQGSVRFTLSVTRLQIRQDLEIDLEDMGETPRTLGNVLAHVNSKLEDAGLETRLATERTPGERRSLKAGSKTIALPPGPDQWALKVKVGLAETVAFSSPATANAVYLAQNITSASTQAPSTSAAPSVQFLKFQTDMDAAPEPYRPPGQSNWVEGQVFATSMGPEIKAVRGEALGPDGSVYLLADVSGAAAGHAIKGQQDVALLKYNSAGRLVFTRTLGAAAEASGLGLAVSQDGQVAIVGSVRGVLGGASDGPLNSPDRPKAVNTDSFLTLFDSDGEELWTARRGARDDDEASQVAFDDNGTIYVAGRAKSPLPGTGEIGGWDGYLEGFATDAHGVPRLLFAQSFGTPGTDRPGGLVVDGDAVIVASSESGHAVLRRYLMGERPELAAVRDLGPLEGGTVTGLALDGDKAVLAGSTRSGVLGDAIVTRAHSGGTDAFVLSTAAALTDGAPHIAYYGEGGDDAATCLAVSDGQIWIGGTTQLTSLGSSDQRRIGFVAQIDVETGGVEWSRRLLSKDGDPAPSAIAIDRAGASILDRLGLPTGPLDLDDSERLTAVSSLRPGDQFTVRVNGGVMKPVAIEAGDTLDSLAQKIRKAADFRAKVSIVTSDGMRRLKVEPASAQALIEIGPGKADTNALALLGIPEGVVHATTTIHGKTGPADGKAPLYGLKLAADLNLSSEEQYRHVLAVLATAQGVVRDAYKGLVQATSPRAASAPSANSGKVPAYIKNQIASYQSALRRLSST